jgi:putative transposase
LRKFPAVLWFARRDRLSEILPEIPGSAGRRSKAETSGNLIDLRTYHHGARIDFSRPGNPSDNGYIEGFNSRLRPECLHASGFLSMVDARQRIEDRRIFDNENRPHSALGTLTPSAHPAQFNAA